MSLLDLLSTSMRTDGQVGVWPGVACMVVLHHIAMAGEHTCMCRPGGEGMDLEGVFLSFSLSDITPCCHFTHNGTVLCFYFVHIINQMFLLLTAFV